MPKVQRRDDGSTERLPLNTLAQYDIEMKLEKQIVRNLRYGLDPNTVPDDMKTFKYFVRDQIVQEDAVYEFDTMTIIGIL